MIAATSRMQCRKTVTAVDSRWLPAPSNPAVSHEQVHVWRVWLDVTEPLLYDLQAALTKDEVARANRYRRDEDRNHFRAARGFLRFILGRYLNAPPERLRFRYDSYGKPSLAPESGGSNLQFSISHSRGLALFAVTWRRLIGVDLEQIRPIPGVEQLVESYFSSSEQEAFRSVSTESQMEAFYRCWTRKEAFVKAKGLGLALPLDSFSVTLAPGEPAGLLQVADDPREVSRWALRDLEPSTGYVGALAVEGTGWRAAHWQWQE
jgi:4'-phosphopantetheinyl transferase